MTAKNEVNRGRRNVDVRRLPDGPTAHRGRGAGRRRRTVRARDRRRPRHRRGADPRCSADGRRLLRRALRRLTGDRVRGRPVRPRARVGSAHLRAGRQTGPPGTERKPRSVRRDAVRPDRVPRRPAVPRHATGTSPPPSSRPPSSAGSNSMSSTSTTNRFAPPTRPTTRSSGPISTSPGAAAEAASSRRRPGPGLRPASEAAEPDERRPTCSREWVRPETTRYGVQPTQRHQIEQQSTQSEGS